MFREDDRFIADTSALSEVRRIEAIGRGGEQIVFERLSELVEEGILIYPAEVVEELEDRWDADDSFNPLKWAKEHKKRATRHGPVLDELRTVLADSQVRRVCDPRKGFGKEDADPHVLALGLYQKQKGREVTVLCQETRDRRRKLSIVSACGLLKLYFLPMEAFLVKLGLLEDV